MAQAPTSTAPPSTEYLIPFLIESSLNPLIVGQKGQDGQDGREGQDGRRIGPQGVPMKPEKKQDALLEKLTLADARKRIDEFRHLKPIEPKSGGAPAPPHNNPKDASPKGKR
jgi:hypothetical protein